MLIVLASDCSPGARQRVVAAIEEAGCTWTPLQAGGRTLLAVAGSVERLREVPLRRWPGVKKVIALTDPYLLASREHQREATVVRVGGTGGVTIGGGGFTIIGGPCAVEDEATLRATAGAVKAAGADLLRGGAYKPRTSPYAFRGLGLEGLRLLREVGRETGLPVVSEVTDPRHVEACVSSVDMLQIGTRNMSNFDLLVEVGKSGHPVLLKRGQAATIQEWLLAAEYVLAQGNSQVVLCERGIRGFDPSTRNVLDLAAVPVVKARTHLPVVVDPSHATGYAAYVPAMARAACAAGADGVMVEVHVHPAAALCDAEQALLPDAFTDLVDDLRLLSKLTHPSRTPSE
jgi:3-deoxy-7-phosphoheptulonate synthase